MKYYTEKQGNHVFIIKREGLKRNDIVMMSLPKEEVEHLIQQLKYVIKK